MLDWNVHVKFLSTLPCMSFQDNEVFFVTKQPRSWIWVFLCQRMTCIGIHIWTGAYMLNLVLEIISLLLVSRRQRSWILLLSEIPEQENMQNFQKWVYYRCGMFWSALCVTSSCVQESLQVCKQGVRPINMSCIFALQKCQRTNVAGGTAKHKCTLRHHLRFVRVSSCHCYDILLLQYFSASLLSSAELQCAAIVIPHRQIHC